MPRYSQLLGQRTQQRQPVRPLRPGGFAARLGQGGPVVPQAPRTPLASRLGQIGNYTPRVSKRLNVGQLQSSLGFAPAPAVPISPGSRIVSSPGTQVTGPSRAMPT